MGRYPSLRKALADKFDDELQFFKGWIDRPRTVGSIVPTSSVTARKMASIVDVKSGLPVLEVGPGTGVITKAILSRGVKPENLYCIEYSLEFVQHLRRIYPSVNVIQGDAFDLEATLGDKKELTFDSVVSGVPLLNFPVPQRIAYIESLLDRIPIGRPIVQLTYGPVSPVPPGKGNYTVEHFHFVLRNIPPTRLLIYRREPHSSVSASFQKVTRDIIERVEVWAGGEEQARLWFKTQKLPALGGLTAEMLVSEGRAEAVHLYLDQVDLGGYA